MDEKKAKGKAGGIHANTVRAKGKGAQPFPSEKKYGKTVCTEGLQPFQCEEIDVKTAHSFLCSDLYFSELKDLGELQHLDSDLI